MNIRVVMRNVVFVAMLAATASAASAVDKDVSGTATRPLPSFDRVMTMSAPRVVGDMELTDQNGRRMRISDLAGAPTLVFFGFTSCPDACPTTLLKLGRLKAAQAKELKGLHVAFISVDGERDTPEVMKKFLQRFSPDFVGLSAPAEQVRPLALRFAAAFFKDPPKDGTYIVQHSTRVYALDKQGRLRAELYDASAEATLGVARALLAE
jgi:protein SCO1/2